MVQETIKHLDSYQGRWFKTLYFSLQIILGARYPTNISYKTVHMKPADSWEGSFPVLALFLRPSHEHLSIMTSQRINCDVYSAVHTYCKQLNCGITIYLRMARHKSFVVLHI